MCPPDTVRRRPTGSLLVYNDCNWYGSTAAILFPDALVVPGTRDDSSHDVLAQVPPGLTHFLFHLDRSVTSYIPRDRSRLVQLLRKRGTVSLNARLVDIRKRRLHGLLASMGLPCAKATRRGRGNDRLIVKTDLNYGGLPEEAPGTWFWTTKRPSRRCVVGSASYVVLQRNEIPRLVWTDSNLVVEHYIENAEGRWWRAIVCVNRFVLLELTSRELIKRLDNSVLRSATLWSADGSITGRTTRLQDLVTRVARNAHMEFGALDVVEDNAGTLFTIDINTTPFFGNLHLSPCAISHLRGALDI